MSTVAFSMPDGTRREGRARCAVAGPKILPCVPLEYVLGWFGGQRTRLRVAMMVSRHHDATREGLALDHGAKLASFDFCPFCGAKLETGFALEPRS